MMARVVVCCFAFLQASAFQSGPAQGASAGVAPVSVRRRALIKRCAGFGAPAKNTKAEAEAKPVFVKSGKKPLEKQWENLYNLERAGVTASQVWVRAQGDENWVFVGRVAAGPPYGAEEALALQKPLIAWTAESLHLRLTGKKQLEYALAPVPAAGDDDDDDAPEAPAGNLSPIAKVKIPAALKAKDVGFKPPRSPLTEHKAGLGAALNPSAGKGSSKFKAKKVAAASD